MGDYHDLYLEKDVILLANVFESFRKICIENYGLDPAHFYTALGLAWKACLKKTGVNLELLKDPDMLLMFERGIRGGITQSVHRWAIANNPYMGTNMTEVNQLNTSNTLMQTIYMVGRCHNHYLLESLNGLVLRTWNKDLKI